MVDPLLSLFCVYLINQHLSKDAMLSIIIIIWYIINVKYLLVLWDKILSVQFTFKQEAQCALMLTWQHNEYTIFDNMGSYSYQTPLSV